MKNKHKTGISLIVLIITIIIMIILAAAIILSLNGSGIIEKANEAATDSNKANLLEAANIALAEYQLKKNTGGEVTEKLSEYVIKKLTSQGFKKEEIEKLKISDDTNTIEYIEDNETITFSFIEGKGVKSADGSIVDRNNYMITDYISCEEGGSYIISENLTYLEGLDLSAGSQFIVWGYDENKNPVEKLYEKYRYQFGVYTHVFIVPSNVKYFVAQFRINDEDISITKSTNTKFISTLSNRAAQGLTVSDDYIYVSTANLENYNSNNFAVTKLNIETGEVILESSDTFGHANSLAYNDDTNELAVLSYDTSDTSTSCLISLLDTDTLTVKSTVDLKDVVSNVCSECSTLTNIDYNTTYNEYYILTGSPERYLITLDGNFNYKSHIYLGEYIADGTGESAGVSTWNGLCSDYNYFYISKFGDWDTRENSILIYDRIGNLVDTKTINGYQDHVEEMAVGNGKFYFVFHNPATIYLIDIK